MAAFVDHLQLLPMPHRGGHRQPDGAHRPGGLGTRTVADRLEERGWVARIEDIAFDKPMSERRLAEAYARGLGDAVLSARDRNRFPLLLLRSGYGALGPIDALGDRAAVAWVGPRGDYGKSGLLRRPSLDSCAVSMVTGRVERDRFAIRPVRLAGGRIVVVGGHRIDGQERRALAGDGIRIAEPRDMAATVAAVDADAWYLHVDLRALRGDAVPGSDEPDPGGVEPDALAGAIGAAFEGRPLRAVGFARYDLNRDEGGRTLATLIQLIEAAVVAAGGVPRPGARAPVR